ncbi:MAG TPA: DinB family protein, partial [Streptosporangiaceae bacterium]|nr:DinB family protein [Streptosporangiaceae bacterium]
MTDDLTPAGYAKAIDEARQRLLDFVRQCPDDFWRSAPVSGDPRPAGVIADHVAHSYEYLAGWIADVAAGQLVAVNAELVDDLNAGHAASARDLTREQVASHLRSSGDALIALVTGLESAQLDFDGGRIRRLAMIAARHADGHRSEF